MSHKTVQKIVHSFVTSKVLSSPFESHATLLMFLFVSMPRLPVTIKFAGNGKSPARKVDVKVMWIFNLSNAFEVAKYLVKKHFPKLIGTEHQKPMEETLYEDLLKVSTNMEASYMYDEQDSASLDELAPAQPELGGAMSRFAPAKPSRAVKTTKASSAQDGVKSGWKSGQGRQLGASFSPDDLDMETRKLSEEEESLAKALEASLHDIEELEKEMSAEVSVPDQTQPPSTDDFSRENSSSGKRKEEKARTNARKVMSKKTESVEDSDKSGAEMSVGGDTTNDLETHQQEVGVRTCHLRWNAGCSNAQLTVRTDISVDDFKKSIAEKTFVTASQQKLR